MLLIPAIDLRGGRCVRLREGSFGDATTYVVEPTEVARSYAGAGARWIHIVDLDAAEGRGEDNLRVIERIRAAVDCRLEVGGGVRLEEQAARLLRLGVDRIVLGTILARTPLLVREWVSRHGARFAGGVDARNRRVRISGWTEEGGISDSKLAAQLLSIGIHWLIYTNIARDGTLAGPDIESTSSVARAACLPTILSGGIGTEDDVRRVGETADSLVVGAILGKALYEGKVDLAGLIRRFPQDRPTGWDEQA